MLEYYDYPFPKELIAQKPASPRDSARLLVYERNKERIVYDVFQNLPKYLPRNAVLVFNETKVLPARLELRKATGGKVTIIYIQTAGTLLKVMADRRLEIGSCLSLKNTKVFRVEKQENKFWFLKPLFPLSTLNHFLEKNGSAPLPPYIRHSPLSKSQLKKEYQAVFAKKLGSIAAPTASLHFTKSLLQKIRRAGIAVEFVTLHVNLGTFAPVTEENVKQGMLHTEEYEIPKGTLTRLNRYKKEGRPIIAVGTTVVRALESAGNRFGALERRQGDTHLFIQPGYHFKFVDSLITNFHVPKSSLLMLAAAFVSRETIMKIYRQAIKRKFRLFSFGDGMLIN